MNKTDNVFWLDIGSFVLLRHIRFGIYGLQWFGKSFYREQQKRWLIQGRLDDGTPLAVKGLANGLKLLNTKLHGQKARILLTLDLDLLRYYFWNQEINDYLFFLSKEKWDFFLITSAKDIKSWIEYGKELPLKIKKKIHSHFFMVFTGFFYDESYLRNLNPQIKMAKDNEWNNDFRCEDNLLLLKKRIHTIIQNSVNFYGHWFCKIYILIDEPETTLTSEWNYKQSFFSALSYEILNHDLPHETTFLFQDEFAWHRNKQMIAWLKSKGYHAAIVSDVFSEWE